MPLIIGTPRCYVSVDAGERGLITGLRGVLVTVSDGGDHAHVELSPAEAEKFALALTNAVARVRALAEADVMEVGSK